MKKSIFFFFLLFSLQAFSQRVAIKNNLVYDALLTPNLSLEFLKSYTITTFGIAEKIKNYILSLIL